MDKTKQLVSFLQGTGADNHHRSLKDMWFFDDYELENSHNYIQWMFPLDTISLYNPFAPFINKEKINEYQTELIQKNMKVSLDVMLCFYGFSWEDDRIVFLNCYKDKIMEWVYPNSHNYLRITRILKSLRLIGLQEYSSNFLEALESVYKLYPNEIGKSIDYWRSTKQYNIEQV